MSGLPHDMQSSSSFSRSSPFNQSEFPQKISRTSTNAPASRRESNSGLYATVKKLEEMVSTLTQENRQLKAKVAQLDDHMSKMDTKMANVDNRVTELAFENLYNGEDVSKRPLPDFYG